MAGCVGPAQRGGSGAWQTQHEARAGAGFAVGPQAAAHGLGQLTAFFGRSFTVIENGIVRMYALVLALGIGALILFLLVRGG